MSQKILSHYDPVTFVHLHSEDARRDKFDECWLIPAFSTLAELVEIPEDMKNIVNVYSPETDTWILQPNFIGQVFYKKENGEEVTIDRAGEVPSTLTNKKRPEVWFVFDNEADNWIKDNDQFNLYIENIKRNKQIETAIAAQAYIDAITQDFAPNFERESYTLQAAEAALWAKNKSAKTPILDGIAAARGVDPEELKAKALEKSQQYQALCAEMSGKRQALEDRINAAKKLEELETIQPSEVFKVV